MWTNVCTDVYFSTHIQGTQLGIYTDESTLGVAAAYWIWQQCAATFAEAGEQYIAGAAGSMIG